MKNGEFRLTLQSYAAMNVFGNGTTTRESPGMKNIFTYILT